MEFAICIVSIAPLREHPSDKSEMTNQVLFGETIEILGSQKDWVQVKLSYDDYVGWMDPKQILYIDEFRYDSLNESPDQMVGDLAQIIINTNNDDITTLPIGSVLPQYSGNKLKIRHLEFDYEGEIIGSDIEPNRNLIVENAILYKNAPYLWGGKTPFGIDCSGLTQMVYKLSGIKLKRDASQQAGQGETVSFITDAFKGDLAFFDNAEGEIIHVGILMGNNKILHASGKVRVDAIDHQGIYNAELKKYTHKLRLIKTYL